MEFKENIERLLNEFLEGRKDLFLMDLKISSSDDVRVILDGDNGVSLQDCLDCSRAIEFNMDREAHDFSLEVMSAGLSEPLTHERQYKKNLGRTLKVETNDGENVEGELTAVNQQGVVLTFKYRKPKEVGKGKVDVVEDKNIAYEEIKKATVVIKF